ncbi:sigma-70 family RNA polymerase sigma factor [Candidatus Uhrbacteria bacterium]|nr:sigma-70 family RNA polymerase sigma factor [Candidatus Uhrbacteria bacterium]
MGKKKFAQKPRTGRRNNFSGFANAGFGADLSPAFLKEIQARAVPTPDEELAYAGIIDREIRRILRISPSRPILWQEIDKRELLRKFSGKARRAFDAMVVRNIRLVISIANRFSSFGAVTKADQVGFGIEGLFQAILRFDPKRKLRFSTYASWWIRHYISRASHDLGPTVRTPIHMVERQITLRRLVNRFYAKHGRNPTVAELAQLADCKPTDIENAQKNQVSVMSLNRKVRESDSAPAHNDEYLDFLVAPEESSPDDEIGKKEDIVRLRLAMERVLSDRERAVLELRFNGGLTLQEIGQRGFVASVQEGRTEPLSRERIRQIEAGALQKLKNALVAP